MNWSFWKFWKRSSPFTGPDAVPLQLTAQQEIRLAAAEPVPPGGGRPVARPAVRPRRSWLGWLTGRNRRRENPARLIQGELLLRQVRPLRNDFREDPGERTGRRSFKVLHETPPTPERRDDQDHAWNRLRNRRPASRVVPVD